MTNERNASDRVIEELINGLDIPDSLYDNARSRYESVGSWLHRKESSVAAFTPAVTPQGSFRLGTVVRPLLECEEYDLDLVCQLQKLCKRDLSQKRLKELVGQEIQGYAAVNGMKEPASEHRRCWRLDYADHVSFHMDILPCIPNDDIGRRVLLAANAPSDLTDLSIAITDKKYPSYAVISDDWLSSNPVGFARWFEGRMRDIAAPRRASLVATRKYASVDQVPAFEWKTPLQRCVQILKRHRDMMFKDNPEDKPISMIITTLCAHAYGGEADIGVALQTILRQMPYHVRPVTPRVPNPTNPAEDFADKWREDSTRERNFWLWHKQASADIATILGLEARAVLRTFGDRFGIRPDEGRIHAALSGNRTIIGVPSPKPVIPVHSPAKPWRQDGGQ